MIRPLLFLLLAATVIAQQANVALDGTVTYTQTPRTAPISTSDDRPLPAQFPDGLVTLDDAGHWVEHAVVDGALVPIQVSNSPLNADTRASLKAAAIAAYRARQTNLDTALGSTELDRILTAVALVENTRINALVDVIRKLSPSAATTNATASIRMTAGELKQAVVEKLP